MPRAERAGERARMPASAGVVSEPHLRPRPESSTVEVRRVVDMDFPAPTEGFVLTHFLVVAISIDHGDGTSGCSEPRRYSSKTR